jgi:hypothetical protein
MVCTAQACNVPTRTYYGLLWLRQQESRCLSSQDDEIETVRCDIRTDAFSLCSSSVSTFITRLLPPLLMLWEISV